jgi:hypothetical protein
MSAKFYYYPMPNGLNLATIDLGEELGELFSDFFVDVRDGVTVTGQRNRSVGRMSEVVRIQRDRMKLGEALAYQFTAMQNHLDRGYSVAFAADHTKAWAAPCQGRPGGYRKSVRVYGSPFTAFADPSGTGYKPAVGDYLVLETQPPGMLHEQLLVDNVTNLSATTGGQIGLDGRIKFSYQTRAFVRHYRFWPCLKRRPQDVGKNIVTNEGGRLFSLDLTLVPDYRVLFAFHPEAGGNNNFDIGSLLTTEIPDSDLEGHTGIINGGFCPGLDGVPDRRFGDPDIPENEIKNPEVLGS